MTLCMGAKIVEMGSYCLAVHHVALHLTLPIHTRKTFLDQHTLITEARHVDQKFRNDLLTFSGATDCLAASLELKILTRLP